MIVYPIIDIRKLGGPSKFVGLLESTIIDVLGQYQLDSFQVCERIGVWISSQNTKRDELIDEKSSILFFLIFPLAVAKTIFRSFNSDFSSGNGIIELIDWWFLRGKILNKDLPLDNADPSGIFQALIL